MQTDDEIILNPGLSVYVDFKIRVRGRDAAGGSVDATRHPELARFIVSAGTDPNATKALGPRALPLLNELLELGVLVPRGSCAEKVGFADCFERATASTDLHGERLVLNEGLAFEAPPADHEWASAIASESAWVWVENPGSRIRFPTPVTAKERLALEKVAGGAKLVSDLDPASLDYFVATGILLRPEHLDEARKRWSLNLEKGPVLLATDGFIVVRELLLPAQLSALKSYFHKLRAEGFYEVDKVQVIDGRSFVQNEPVAQVIHRQLTWAVSQISGAAIKPSFSYLTMYHPRAVLARHTDRPQAVWNVSLAIAHQPEESRVWPLNFDFEGRVGSALLNPGDAVIYPGTKVPHWREALPEGETVTALVSLYVPSSFEGSLD